MANQNLIDVGELSALLGTESLVIADCRFSLAEPERGRAEYERGHLPGASFFDLARDLSAPVGAHGGRHPLPDPSALGARLAQAGVHASSLVVAYDDSRFGFAARFWWLLRYLGHQNVRVLDGGLKAWLSAGLPLSTAQPPPRHGSFVPRVDSSLVATREEVLAQAIRPEGSVNLIDAREPKRFRGEEEPIDPVAGRIPGALSFPWQDYTSVHGVALSDEANRERWATLDRGRPSILYCGSGVTACVNALSLDNAGVSNVRLYAGSFSDWCSFADSPIAVG